MKTAHRLTFVVCIFVAPTAHAALSINLNAGANLTANTAALNAFQAAAQQWESLLGDDITVNIDADLSNAFSNPLTIGTASSAIYGTSFNNLRNALVADAANEADDAIVASLSTLTTSQFTLPSGVGMSGFGIATGANMKALGLLPAHQALSDATITFNSNFSFDYDNSDGVTPGTVDFETVALHEIGHALGFASTVDEIDFGETSASPFPLDFFRFADGADPSNAAEFASNDRNLVPGDAALFDDTANEWALSTGVNDGDGRQASHWKDNALTGDLIGLLDPTLPAGLAVPITYADLRVLDLIGYEFTAVPEASQLLFGALVISLMGVRKAVKRR
ncbi:MAG: hypothetical protein CMJ58_01725 [Planctomycetaceae bacterium]|nr:hypothetical protein [Planctomycetaceae bacterium]